MFVQRRGARRFTLLLLDEGEDYVQDWVGSCAWPASVPGNWQGVQQLPGRIRLCTRSLFFEADDVRVPIVRLLFASITTLEPDTTAAAAGAKTMRLLCKSCTKMKANLAEEPYVHEHTPAPGAAWQVSLSYSPLAPLLAATHELLAIARLPGKAERNAALELLVRRREDAASFDSSRLVDFSERLAWTGAATQLTPLVREGGLLVVSDQRVYFQPLHNVAGGAPVRSHPLAGIAAVARRRSSLRPIGLELFFVDAAAAAAAAAAASASAAGVSPGAAAQQQVPPGLSLAMDQRRQRAADEMGTGPWWDAPSAFFTFRSESDREAALAALTGQPAFGRAASSTTLPPLPSSTLAPEPLLQTRGLLLEAEGAWLQRVAAAWQHGRVSNFDYLLYLNLAAGRSFNDLAQWPVFPWVLSNYVTQTLDLDDASNFRDLSKPMGALNPARLNEFRKRYHEMQTDAGFEGSVPPFMYGTHYSTPGYVMYWLVRAAPAHMLRLQNGHFDAPDRLFCSLHESWQCVNTSTTDVKELIPEFYLPQPEFLQNLQNLLLGIRQNGQAVGDVVLPPWAGGSPSRFLAMHHAALEAPTVSANLHHWIDLIFGYKQRGSAAEAADNVFYYLTYEGAVDLSSSGRDPTELKALETQINEFGQVPTQLFEHPHPARLVTPPAPDPDTVFGFGWQQGQQTQGPRHQHGGHGGQSSGDGESGSRALALALVSTVLAAAAPEFAATTSPASPPPARSPAAAASAQGSITPVTASNGGPVPSPSSASSASAASVMSPGGRTNSLFASFLKLGRYTSQDMGSGASNTGASTSGAGATASSGAEGAANKQDGRGTAAMQGSTTSAKAVPSASASPGKHVAGVGTADTVVSLSAQEQGPWGEEWQLQAGPDSEAHQEDEEDEGGGLLVRSSANIGTTAPTTTFPTPAVPAMPAAPPRLTQTASPASTSSKQGMSADTSRTRMGGEGLTDPMRTLPQPGATSGQVYCLSSDAGGSAGPWGMGLPRRLHGAGAPATRRVRLGGGQGLGATTAVVLGAWGGNGGGDDDSSSKPHLDTDTAQQHNGFEAGSMPTEVQPTYVYCVGHGGHLHVLPFHDPHRPLRSAVLDGDLLCLAALAPCPTAGTDVRQPHPILLAGSHTCRVQAYSVDQGRLLGSWEAHNDAVCCALLTPAGACMTSGSGPRLVTSSWDCSVKVWNLSEGRCPWSGSMQLPEAQLQEFEAGVWAITAPGPGTAGGGGLSGPSLLVTGTEEGLLQAWDLRAKGGGGGSVGSAAWQAAVADDYVGGLQLDPMSGRFVVAATADGALSLLDVRMSGARLAKVVTGTSPLRCCASDGRLCVAGSEAGMLHLWDVALMSASGPGVGGQLHQPAPDGQYAPWQEAVLNAEAINGLALMLWPGHVMGAGAHPEHGRAGRVQAAMALESGCVALLEV